VILEEPGALETLASTHLSLCSVPDATVNLQSLLKVASRQEQRFLHLLLIDGLTLEEVAAEMHVTRSTIYVYHRRLWQKLHRL
jgi:DNA-binding NarL/FixJ family response regulator